MEGLVDNAYIYNILAVDDTPANLKVLSEMLKEQGFKARAVPSGKLALQAARNNTPDLILLDINMPEMNGYEVCNELKKDEKLRDIPVIFISALNDALDKVKAFSSGGVDYITKPFQFEEVKARIETHLKLSRLKLELEEKNNNLEELVDKQVQEISNLQMTIIFAMAKLAQSRDDDTGKHLERVQLFCSLIAEKLEKNETCKREINRAFINNIINASPLHDIGKVGIPDNILLKPGKLTLEEFEVMKTHTIIGAETLEEVKSLYPHNKFITMGIDIARHHHEKWDGSGYPHGLAGEQIPLAARIMAVVDVYDALKSKRVYKPALSHQECCEIIQKGSGIHFDPNVVNAFLEINNEMEKTWQIHQDK